MSGRSEQDGHEAFGGGGHRRGKYAVEYGNGCGGVLRLVDVIAGLSLWAAAGVAVIAAALYYSI